MDVPLFCERELLHASGGLSTLNQEEQHQNHLVAANDRGPLCFPLAAFREVPLLSVLCRKNVGNLRVIPVKGAFPARSRRFLPCDKNEHTISASLLGWPISVRLIGLRLFGWFPSVYGSNIVGRSHDVDR